MASQGTDDNGRLYAQCINEAGTAYLAVKSNAGGAMHVSLQEIEAALEIESAGDTAHGAADAGNPVKIGGKASASEPAAVDESDRTNAMFDLYGNQKVVGNIAHDAADRGDPVKIGGKANAEEPAAVTENDRVNLGLDLKGNTKVCGNIAHDTADAGNPVKVGGKGTTAVQSAVGTTGDRTDASFDTRGCLRIVGDTAHDAADTGEPVKVGAKGNAEEPAAATEGDRVNVGADLYGNLRAVGNVAHSTIDRGNPIKIGGIGTTAVGAAVTSADRTDASFDTRGCLRTVGDTAHDAADTGEPLKVGAKASTALMTAVTEGDRCNLSTDLQGQLRILKQGLGITLKTAGEVTGSGNSTTVTGLDSYTHLEVLLNVTAAATEVGDILDVYIDASPDGGTTWVNVIHFTQILGNGGAKKVVAGIHLAANLTDVDVTSDLAANAAPRSFLGNALRERHVVTDAGDDNAAFTYAVMAIMKQA